MDLMPFDWSCFILLPIGSRKCVKRTPFLSFIFHHDKHDEKNIVDVFDGRFVLHDGGAWSVLQQVMGVGVTLIRLLVNLLEAEEIVSSLAIQVLMMSLQGGPMMYLDGMVQPLDILVVQAKTSLALLLYLLWQINKLDPSLLAEDNKWKDDDDKNNN